MWVFPVTGTLPDGSVDVLSLPRVEALVVAVEILVSKRCLPDWESACNYLVKGALCWVGRINLQVIGMNIYETVKGEQMLSKWT